MYEQWPTQYLSWAEFHREDLVLGRIRGAFSGVSPLLAPSFCSSLLPFYSCFSLLTGVPRVGICPILPYLQLLGMVIRTEKYGCVRHKALSTIEVAFLCTHSFYLSSFSTFVLSLPCETVWSFTIDGLLPLLPSAISIRGGFFHGRGGVFPWTGPLAQYRYSNGPISLFPPIVRIIVFLKA